MKILFKLVFLALVGVLITNCKKDDDNFASLVGTWNLTDIHTDNGTSTVTFLGIPVTGTYTFHGIDYNATTTFTENPNEFVSSGDYTYLISVNYAGVPQTEIDTIEVSSVNSGEWEINGDKLTQFIAGDSTVLTIEELTDSKLRVRYDQDVIFEDQGIIVHDKATIYSTFEK